MNGRGRIHGGDLRGRPPEVSSIEPRLFVGEYPRAEDVGWLRARYSISAVVSLQDDDDLLVKGLRLPELLDEYESHGIEFRRIPIADNDPVGLGKALSDAVATLHQLLGDGHGVLLHCNAGYNRAPTVAIAYLHRHRSLDLVSALELVKSRRPCVPFMSVLERWAAHR